MAIKRVSKKSSRSRIMGIVIVAGVLVVLAFTALLIIRLITGHGLGISTFAYQRLHFVSSLTRAILDSDSVTENNQGEYTNILFVHHSTGYYLITQGGVREQFQAAGYDFWDHDYNEDGLRRPNGVSAGYSYNIPDDNTNPDGYARIFAQPVHRLPWNTFSGLLQHEVIIFKSCFPVSHIESDSQLNEYKSNYLAIRDVMDAHPNKLFIVMTPPPLNPAATTPEAAARARAFSNWLTSDEYLGTHSNVFAFDFFGYLTEDDPATPDQNMLREQYREGSDSHPNQLANETIGPLLVNFVIEAIESR